MQVNVTTASAGDIAGVSSPMVTVESTSCLTFDLFMSEGAILDIHVEDKIRELKEQQLCTIVGESYPRWQSIHKDMWPGTYYLGFVATVMSSYDEVRIDNITLHTASCADTFRPGTVIYLS